MSADAPAERPAWRRPWLGGDGARGLGALLVFAAHVATAEGTYATVGWDGLPGRDIDALFGGAVGWHAVFAPARLVNLFFAFSAYLLARPFLAWALGRTARPSAWRFYVRRALRILPAFWAVCLLVLLWLVVLGDGAANPGRALATLLLVHGGLDHAGFASGWAVPLAPAWTVRVEALGYLLLPLVAWGWWAATRRWAFRGLTAGLAVAGAVALVVRFAGDQTHDGPGPLQWLFLPGLAVAAIEAHDPTREWLARRGRTPTLWWTLAAFLVLIGSEPAGAAITEHLATARGASGAAPDALAGLLQEPLRWGAALAVPMQLVGATGLLLGLIALEWQGGRPPIGLDSRLARWFGARSYAFYLVHFAVLGGLLPHVATGQKGLVGLLALGAGALAVSLVVTVVLHRGVERPGMLLAARLTGRRPPGPLAVGPAAEGPSAGTRTTNLSRNAG